MSQDSVPTLEEKTGGDETKNSTESAFSAYIQEENTLIGSKEQESIVPLPSSELVFEITYLDDPIKKTSAEVYTKTEPVFALNGVVSISDAFGSTLLKEVVLGRENVERRCRKELQNTTITVDCKQGILIKAIEPQDWMFQDEKTTKQEFDKVVLETFRVVQEKITKELHDQALYQAQIQAQIEEQARIAALNKTNGNGGNFINEGVPIHNPVYNLKPGDPGYNPNNDPNRRGKPMPVNDEALDDI